MFPAISSTFFFFFGTVTEYNRPLCWLFCNIHKHMSPRAKQHARSRVDGHHGTECTAPFAWIDISPEVVATRQFPAVHLVPQQCFRHVLAAPWRCLHTRWLQHSVLKPEQWQPPISWFQRLASCSRTSCRLRELAPSLPLVGAGEVWEENKYLLLCMCVCVCVCVCVCECVCFLDGNS